MHYFMKDAQLLGTLESENLTVAVSQDGGWSAAVKRQDNPQLMVDFVKIGEEEYK